MASERIDFAAEGLLDGLQGSQREERVQLLEYLAAEGVELSELRRTTASGTVMFLPAERLISGEERYTAAEVAQRSGIELEFLLALRRAMGLPIPDPNERAYTTTDLEMAQMTTQGSPTRRCSSWTARSGARWRRRPRHCERCRCVSSWNRA